MCGPLTFGDSREHHLENSEPLQLVLYSGTPRHVRTNETCGYVGFYDDDSTTRRPVLLVMAAATVWSTGLVAITYIVF